MSREIRNRIRELAQLESVHIQSAIVTEINENNRTISAIIEGDLELSNIRLTAWIDEESDSFAVMYPKLKSDVLIAEIEEGVWVVLIVSEIQKYHFKKNGFELEIENGKVKGSALQIEWNGGENKGLVRLEPLTQTLESIVAWIQKIDFVLKNTQVVAVAPGTPDPLQIALKAAIITSQVPKVPNLENPKIKH